jgi:hypothetical protein
MKNLAGSNPAMRAGFFFQCSKPKLNHRVFPIKIFLGLYFDLELFSEAF